MEVEILEFVQGAQKARGVAVIIDVFRAFSVACYAFDAGVSRIIATATPEDAFILKHKNKNSILVGERHEKKIEGFDLGNSPTEMMENDLRGKTIIQTTTSGTNGLVNASKADIIVTGSLVNLSAVVRYVKNINPEHVSLVAMGYRATQSAEEDLLCAEMIASGIKDNIVNSENAVTDLKFSSGSRFFKPENIDFSPPTDFFLCTMVDRFNFVLKAETRFDGNVELFRIDF